MKFRPFLLALALASTSLTTGAESSLTARSEAVRPAPTLFDAELARSRLFLDEMIAAGIHVPQPVDPGGGASHEQHKRNYRALYEAGQQYRLPGVPA